MKNEEIHPLKIFQKKQQRQFSLYFIICFLIIVTFFSSLLIIIAVYFQNWSNPFIIKISQKLPLPALIVNKNIIWLKDYYQVLKAVESYYQYQDPSYLLNNNQLKIQVLLNLIEQELIEEAAHKYQISVSDNDLAQEIKSLEQNLPDQNFDQLTKEIFGWDFNEFINRVIRVGVLRNKLNQYFVTQPAFQIIAWSEINNYYNQLAKGVAFAEIGEAIGWFRKGDLNVQIFEKIKDLTVGQVSEIIETDNGYYLLKLENKVILEDQQTGYQLSQIFVKKYDLNNYLQERFQKVKIYQFIKI